MSAPTHLRRGDGDRGVALLLVALALVVLLVFVAFAVDLGRVYGERRQDQSAADSGALSGAYQMLLGTPKTDLEIFNQVTQITYDDLDPSTRPSSLAAWRTLWTTCTDAAGAASTSVYKSGAISPSGVGTIQCIRKSSNGKQLRVRIPDRNVSTFFAGVIGIKSLKTYAVAEAGVSAIDTGVLPFAIGPFSGAGVVCLTDPPSGLSVTDVCPGSDTGKFGYIISPRPSWDAGPSCVGGNNNTIQQNIAQGLDHHLAPWAGTNVLDECTGPLVVGTPTLVDARTGSLGAGVLEDGLITGKDEGGSFADGQPARLVRPSSCDSRKTLPGLNAYNLEWCGVWRWMLGPSQLVDVPQSCVDLANGLNESLAGVKTCFDEYVAGNYTGQLFSDQILTSKRFGWVPETVNNIDGSGGSTVYPIKTFRPVFLQTLYFVQGSGNTYAAYDPGQTLPSGCGNCSFRSLTALAFAPSMLPAAAQDPYSDLNRQTSISLLK